MDLASYATWEWGYFVFSCDRICAISWPSRPLVCPHVDPFLSIQFPWYHAILKVNPWVHIEFVSVDVITLYDSSLEQQPDREQYVRDISRWTSQRATAQLRGSRTADFPPCLSHLSLTCRRAMWHSFAKQLHCTQVPCCPPEESTLATAHMYHPYNGLYGSYTCLMLHTRVYLTNQLA